MKNSTIFGVMNCNQHCGRPLVSNFTWEDGVTVSMCNLPMVPSWMLAVLIGLLFGFKYLSLGRTVTGSLSYAVTYFMYAAMISSGLVVHCLCLYECTGAKVDHTVVYQYSAVVDVGLTCCIAISFAFNGLIDLKWIPERSYLSWGTVMSLYGLVFYSYINHLKIAPTVIIVVRQQGETIGFAATRVADKAAKLFKALSL